MSNKYPTTLSNGVELGAWAYPAGKDALPPGRLDILTHEEVVALILENQDLISDAIDDIQMPTPLHIPIRWTRFW